MCDMLHILVGFKVFMSVQDKAQSKIHACMYYSSCEYINVSSQSLCVDWFKVEARLDLGQDWG